MNGEVVLALAATPRDWAQRLHRHVTEHGGARIRVTVLTASEALGERYDILLADDRTSFLSARLVRQLHAVGRAVVGLYDPDDPRAKGELLDWGVDDALSCELDAPQLLAELTRLPRAADATPGTDVPIGAVTPTPAPLAHGRTVVVRGAGGGCGGTEIALALACRLATVAGPTVLAELDETAASLAPRLGLPPYPNLRAAVDWSRRGAGASLQAVQTVSPSLAVLVAGPLPRRLSPPAADDVAAVLDDLSARADWLVVDAGTARWSAHHDAATHVVVANASPVGTVRGSELLSHWTEPTPPHVVLNRSPEVAFRRWELAEELTRAGRIASVTAVPDDRRVTDATWTGRPVARGPFSRAVTGLVDRLVSPQDRP